MKPILEWIKTNWIVTVIIVLALLGAPAMAYFSNKMNTDLRTKIEKDVQTDYTEITKAKVQYAIPDLNPAVEGEPWSTEINAAKTTFFGEQRTSVAEAIREIKESGLAFNTRHRELLVTDLFPAPSEENRQTAPGDLYKRFRDAHVELIASMKGGAAAPKQAVGEQLDEVQRRETARILNEKGGTSLTSADQKALADDLLQIRVGIYQQRASEVKVFADAASFPNVPQDEPNPMWGVATCWDRQEQYWVHADICRAIAAANGPDLGRGVPDSVVKRIVKMRTPEKFNDGVAQSALDQAEAYDPTGGIPWTDVFVPDATVSVTGRRSGSASGNKYFDVREVDVEFIVETRRLPEFFDALAAENFMTVLSCVLTRVDLTDELRAGYYYGEEPVARAAMRIECLLLRNETVLKDMPKGLRRHLGIPDPEPVEGEPAADEAMAG